jgi:effector-binding domain-containing protein
MPNMERKMPHVEHEMPHMEHKSLGETRVAGFRRVLKDRVAIRDALRELRQRVPEELVAGSPYCIIQFVTSVRDGYDAEVGVPVTGVVEDGPVVTRVLPAMDVLSLVHTGSSEALGTSYGELYGHAAKLGIISDEFCREVYGDWGEGGGPVEIQFVVHRWSDLLARNAARVLGDTVARRAVGRGPTSSRSGPGIDATQEERFRWVKAAVEKIEEVATEEQRYDILSSCAHVFPEAQIDKLRAVYRKARAETGDGMQAVDAVLDFMEADPGWGSRPRREGRVIRTSKAPRDKAAYDKAETDAERRSAYCFCPLIRDRLDEGMPGTFCYCGAGWFRRQWEGATGKPVSIEIVRSVLKGDDACEFAVTLSEEL